MTTKSELRSTLAELRAAEPRKLSGHACVWGAVANLGSFNETFQRGAFADPWRIPSTTFGLYGRTVSTGLWHRGEAVHYNSPKMGTAWRFNIR